LPYESAIVLHKLLTELHIGMLSLAAMAALAALCFSRRARGARIAQSCDGAFVAAGTGGTIFLLLSAVTGFLAWPWERLWRTAAVYGKIGYAVLALVLWSSLLWLRLRRGERMWKGGRSAIAVLVFTLLALAATALASSAGGHLGHGHSLLDWVPLRVNPYVPIVLPPWASVGIIVSGSFLTASRLAEEGKMKRFSYIAAATLFVASAGLTSLLWKGGAATAQVGHREHKAHGTERAKSSTAGGEKATHLHGKTERKPKLHPPEGASVKILSPKPGAVIKGDTVPLRFKLVKGKRGEHVHAYVDGELMGMFKSETGTLTGIKPGRHTLELRVVAADHETELDATDRVTFVVE
jgi:hypothetical protein